MQRPDPMIACKPGAEDVLISGVEDFVGLMLRLALGIEVMISVEDDGN